mmetsp:Transcript_28708/g.55868  ORF Transcript_28708/g.55868 Transcript_28708/m.55868 type:complete len:205 (-) Transcript_28708:95-709(-)
MRMWQAWIPRDAYSFAMDDDKARSPCFAIASPGEEADPLKAAVELVNKRVPVLSRSIPGRTARAQRSAPRTSTFHLFFTSSIDIPKTPDPDAFGPEALNTRTFTGPNFSSTSLKPAATFFSSVTSVGTKIVFLSKALILLCTSAQLSALRDIKATSKPLSANLKATLEPKPGPHPTTATTPLASRKSSLSWAFRGRSGVCAGDP